ncbi:MAG: FAD-dependent oxidoreductase, partial [Halofilum sp. (in: g-proteobacteria)]
MQSPRGNVLVLGAGIAGSATAAALAERGYRVIIVDSSSEPAASAVPLALMAPYPTRARDPLTRLRTRGLTTTRGWLTRLEQTGLDSGRRSDGVLLIPARPRDRQRRDRFTETQDTYRVSPHEAHAHFGVTSPESAVFHAGGACIDPMVFVGALLRSAGIRRLQARVADLEHRAGQWHALDDAGHVLASATNVVVAAGYASTRFAAAAADQLTPLRGQATAVTATPETRALRCAVSHGGYILPTVDGMHWVGATATRDDTDGRPRD